MEREKEGLNNENTKKDNNEISELKEVEIGGQNGPEPTRYGDWEKNGRCTDF